MRLISKYYTKFCKHRQSEIKRIVRSEVAQSAMKQCALNCFASIVRDGMDCNNIIVSLTTFGKRINSVYLAIESIAQQTLKPNKVILWLSEDHFSSENLPITIKRLIARGLTVCFRKDVGPHTKGIYAFKEFPNDIIITVDDDMIYPVDLVENLYNAHKKDPEAVCCNVAVEMLFDNNGEILPWGSVKYKIKESSLHFLPLGVNGVLYPPVCFDKELYDINKIKSLSPLNDDIWFKLMSLKHKQIPTTIVGCSDRHEDFAVLDSAHMNALAEKNVIGKRNYEQLKATWDYYNIKGVLSK